MDQHHIVIPIYLPASLKYLSCQLHLSFGLNDFIVYKQIDKEF